MTVNLFDNTFRQSDCSTAGAVPEHMRYVRDRHLFDGVTLFTDGFTAWPIADSVHSRVKLGWLHEPPCLIPDVYADAVGNAPRFDAVLTYHPELLGRPGFQFMPYAGVWIEREHWGMREKSRPCSMLIGSKSATEGHRLRPLVADAVADLGVDFFGVRGYHVDYGPAAKRAVLGDYAFSIVGEACRIDNLFTEILLDCFAVGTIPIFWGCPNIGDFFDSRGVLSFETPAQCAAIVRGLSMDLYESLAPYAAENLRQVADFAVAENWLYDHILRAYEN